MGGAVVEQLPAWGMEVGRRGGRRTALARPREELCAGRVGGFSAAARPGRDSEAPAGGMIWLEMVDWGGVGVFFLAAASER